MDSSSLLHQKITSCLLCPRLRSHCESVAQVKRRAYLAEEYWGKPVPPFGPEEASLVIIGLAPAAHGANRTGRMFTGDRSGEWLYRALHKRGFATQATSMSRGDGLTLRNAYITSVVKCAPPDNKPLPEESHRCVSLYLAEELRRLNRAKVYLALGQIALAGAWRLLEPDSARPPFKHGSTIRLRNGKWLILSYHPSQQNTFTKRLTQKMFDSVFLKAHRLLESAESSDPSRSPAEWSQTL